MTKKNRCITSLFFAAAVMRGSALADTAADSSAVVSPYVQSAISRLASADYQEREKALADLEAAFARQAFALAANQSPEARSRIDVALEFSTSLNRWIADVLKMPLDERREQIAFISRNDLISAVALIFSDRDETRAEGVRKLGAVSDASADLMLAHLVNDESRAVSLAAMEVLWDRKPSEPILDVLWRRAVESDLSGSNPRPTPVLTFRGRPVPDTSGLFMTRLAARDNEIACEVLVHLQAPQVGKRIDDYLDRAVKALAEDDPRVAQPYFSNTGSARNIYVLIEAYKPESAIIPLFTIATGRVVREYSGHNSNGTFYFSNRTSAIAAVLMLTHQNPDDYGLQRLNTASAPWVFRSQLVENDAIAKLQMWHSHWQAPEERSVAPH